MNKSYICSIYVCIVQETLWILRNSLIMILIKVADLLLLLIFCEF